MSYIVLIRLKDELLGMSHNGDMEDRLEEFESEEDAENAMENHMLFNCPYKIIEVGI